MADINMQTIMKNKDNVVIAVLVVISLVISKDIYGKHSTRYLNITSQITTEKEKGLTLDRILVLNDKIKKNAQRSWNTLDLNIIVGNIYDIGSKSGVKIREVSPRGKKEEKNYTLSSYSVTCEGTYKDVSQFVKNLEDYSMLIRINEFESSPMGDTRSYSDPTLIATIGAEVIYLK